LEKRWVLDQYDLSPLSQNDEVSTYFKSFIKNISKRKLTQSSGDDSASLVKYTAFS